MLSGEIGLVLAQLKEEILYSYVGSEQIISKTGIKRWEVPTSFWNAKKYKVKHQKSCIRIWEIKDVHRRQLFPNKLCATLNCVHK